MFVFGGFVLLGYLSEPLITRMTRIARISFGVLCRNGDFCLIGEVLLGEGQRQGAPCLYIGQRPRPFCLNR
jgi:hypothetical protein